MIFQSKAGKNFLLSCIVLIFLSGCCSEYVDDLDEALQCATPEGARPVTKEILAFNKERENAGLPPVGADWKIASMGDFFIYDIFITVLLDEQKSPAKIIYVVGYSNIENYSEYTVRESKRNGKAAYWVGIPLKLSETMEYKDNKLNGTATYFSSDGKVICSCIFKDDQPWSGRKLERSGFEKMRSDISYKEGKQDGLERSYSYYEGKLEELKTFKNGIQDGVAQHFYMGTLYDEYIFEDGVCRYSKSFYKNGKIEWEHHYSKQGKSDGLTRKWDESGNLIVERNYHEGEQHGRFWQKGHSEVWFWNNKYCCDKAEFDKLEQEAKSRAK